MKDCNFDTIAEKFSRNIYGTTKGAIRQAILWQDISTLLTQLPERPLTVLDAGGGEGQLSCRLAALGHQVLLCDISDKMLTKAKQLAQQKGVSHNMQFLHSPVQEMATCLKQPVELILFHAVLEWVVNPQQVLEKLYTFLKPGGVLSLMFFNATGLLMRNMVLGNFRLCAAENPPRRKASLTPYHPMDPDSVCTWLLQMDMRILGKSGVRVFHDYLQNRQQQTEDFAQLLALEQRYCRQEPFISLGRYIHVMALKPRDKS